MCKRRVFAVHCFSLISSIAINWRYSSRQDQCECQMQTMASMMMEYVGLIACWFAYTFAPIAVASKLATQTSLVSWTLVSHMLIVLFNAHLNSKCICCVYANTSKYRTDGPLARGWEWMWSIHKQRHPKLYLAFTLSLARSFVSSFVRWLPFICSDFAQPINTNDISNGNSCNKCRRKNVA